MVVDLTSCARRNNVMDSNELFIQQYGQKSQSPWQIAIIFVCAGKFLYKFLRSANP